MNTDSTYAFGCDWDITAGDLTYDGQGQPKYATGVALLTQALYCRLVAQRLLLHPEYGGNLGEFVDEPLTPTIIARIKQVCHDQALMDARVEAVLGVDVTPLFVPLPGMDIVLRLRTTISPDVLSLALPPITSPT